MNYGPEGFSTQGITWSLKIVPLLHILIPHPSIIAIMGAIWSVTEVFMVYVWFWIHLHFIFKNSFGCQ